MLSISLVVTKVNLIPKWALSESHDLFLKFGAPVISLEQMKLAVVCILTLMSSIAYA